MRTVVAFALCVVALTSGCGRAAAISAGKLSIQSGGLTRTYALYVPPSLDAKQPVPLLVVLHGHFGTGPDAMTRYHIAAVADKYGFIAVAPDGVRRAWNDGRFTTGKRADGDIDDVGFISDLVAHLEQQYSIDPRRIYVAGMSNGAMMAQVMGCERSDLFAAVASVAGSLPVSTVCSPKRPLSVMLIDGTGDPVVPFGGGPVARQGQQSEVIGADRTIAFWLANDRCNATPVRANLPDVDPTDGTTISTATYSSCADGTSVALYTVSGGGHEWPGGSPTRILPLALGKLNNDINATNVIWQFFEQHPR